ALLASALPGDADSALALLLELSVLAAFYRERTRAAEQMQASLLAEEAAAGAGQEQAKARGRTHSG
ncbi:hypothetical protein HaLaN_12458, partial [Haematococcus lacustris]